MCISRHDKWSLTVEIEISQLRCRRPDSDQYSATLWVNEAAVPKISKAFIGGSNCGILGYNQVNAIFVLLRSGRHTDTICSCMNKACSFHMSIFFWGVVHLEDPFETKYAARLCTGADFAALWQHLKAWVSLFIVFLHPNPCVCGTWNRLKTDCKMCSPCLDPVPCSAAWKQYHVLWQISGEPRKKPSYLPLYWLFNRDPYNGLLQSLCDWVV